MKALAQRGQGDTSEISLVLRTFVNRRDHKGNENATQERTIRSVAELGKIFL